nr:filamentous hemagglutinin N-terminal domain-containing protein [Pleurocapsa sp. MO_192.B19]
MAKTRTLFQRQLLTILIFLLAGMTLAPRIANGQIVPDDTLGKENSTVRQDVIKDVDSDIIEGGATRGANLFHSFTDFNVDVRRGAYFANPDAIDNILSRVTGSNSSSILGTLGVLGDANLFLINPNGIVFGENARLDVGGSFFASTADSLLFDNGFEFSGSDPQAPPLLTVNIPVGLGFRDDPGSITNQSRAVDSNENPVGLQMQSGKDITFAGGDITLDGGKITAPGGRVELGGLAAAGTVELSNDGSLSFPDDIERADLKLSNDASVNVRAAEGGFITVNANNVELVEGSTLLAGIKLRMGSPNAEAGDITINSTGSVSLTNGSQLSIRVRGQGDGGNVIINAKDKVLFDGVGDGSPSAAFSTIREEGEGNAGNIEIITSSLVLTHGSQLSTSTFGQGNAGDVILAVEGAVELVGGDIFSTVEAGAVGEGGNIAINGESLSLSDGAQLQTLVRQADENIPAGKGNAGNINIQVDDAVVISGVGSDGSVSLITSELQTGATGSAGNVNIQASSLSLNGEGNAISSTTSGRGNAGDVILAVEGAVELVGGDIFSTVEAGAVGAGGNIKINGQSLFLTDDAQLQTLVRGAKGTTLAGKGNAGNINIQIGSLSLNGETNKIISSTFGQGDAGDVTIEAEGAVELVGGEISSNVESRAEGNGGEIDITANHLSLTKKAKLNTSTSGQG